MKALSSHSFGTFQMKQKIIATFPVKTLLQSSYFISKVRML